MTILAINDINRKENFIYYRREFTGEALYDLPDRRYAGKIDFTIETMPTGKKEISITMIDSVDYPVLPVLHTLKEYILRMDNDGLLP